MVQVAVVGHEAGLANRLQCLFDHRVAAILNLKSQAVVDLRPGIIFRHRQLRECRRQIEHGERPGGAYDCIPICRDEPKKILEHLVLKRQRSFGGLQDLRCLFRQFGARKPHRTCQGLTVNKGLRMGRLHQFIAVFGADIDMIAEHIVVFDLEAGDPCLAAVFYLKRRDQSPAFAAQRPEFVERCMVLFSHEATVAGQERRFRHKGFLQLIQQPMIRVQPGQRLFNLFWNRIERGRRDLEQPPHFEALRKAVADHR